MADWALVIFASRESTEALRRTLASALVSAHGLASIDVLVNGNSQLASDIAKDVGGLDASARHVGTGLQAPRLRIWSIPFGDKANAWNQYIASIWNGETIAFFVDGYVRLNADAIALLGQAVAANEQALGGTGVPTMGWSAKSLRTNLITNTGFHGNLCCIKGVVLEQMRKQAIRLPIGLYRTDSLMGAFLCFAMDPTTHQWEDFRIHVQADASWQIDVARWWHPQDLRAFFRRLGRQSRGLLENRAISEHLVARAQLPQDMPGTACELVRAWSLRCSAEFHSLWKVNPLVRRAYRQVCEAKMPAEVEKLPVLISQS